MGAIEIYVFHLLVFGPLLLYLGLCQECNQFIKYFAVVMGIMAIGYHGWKLVKYSRAN
jgi:hypothetical protein